MVYPGLPRLRARFATMGKAEKREAEAPAEAPRGKKTAPPDRVNPKRVRELAGGAQGSGPVIYWMSRDQRVTDNWALLYACEAAARTGAPVAVAFNLVPEFLGAGARQFGFMLRALRLLEPKLRALGIPLFMLSGDPTKTIPELAGSAGAALMVCDYSPLRLGRAWRDGVAERLSCPFHEVDAHNIVPAWLASGKREYAARTLRPKIHAALPEFLTDLPQPVAVQAPWSWPQPEAVDWDALLGEALRRGAAVPEVAWLQPGEDAAVEALRSFLTKDRLALYDAKRNDPCVPNAQSGLSPYLHFGHLAPQRAAVEASRVKAIHKASVDSFLEELVVRRELADNFCHYEPLYDSIEAGYGWARETLAAHAADKREYLYTREQLEAAQTHDKLWNAAQLEMVSTGRMHGFMRMYWAKKILEWTASPEEALASAIALNDTYQLDGRDPNGYVGCMWSIAGIHDQGWAERAVFGKIRFMNYAGCKRKFDIEKYCARVEGLVRAARGKGDA